ncbi:MAG: helix-turn-helix domain-containing protein [Paracoccaceae bacterium]|nr:helix-turn-helix domain-containing protein [Paracoccaceae bacterium]
MAKTRSYKLLCPIARALDRIGDRWTLLILRDLHAGPARFSDLQRGLTGIAANLLTDRLGKLVEDGLITRREAGHGASVYALTDLGTRTSDVIFDLALFGGLFPPEGEVVTPGNLRTVATTLGAAAKRVVTPDMAFEASIVVDGEEMHLTVQGGAAQMLYARCPDPDLVFTTSYTDLLAFSEGEIAPAVFAQQHSTLDIRSPGKEQAFLTLMARVTALLQGQPAPG